MRMKKSVISICLILILCVASISFASHIKKTGFLENNNTQNQKAQEAARQIENIILDAWTDIEATFSIDTNKYYVITASDFESLLNHFEKKEATSIFLGIVSPLLSQVPKGSIVPALYINHDKEELLFCYKQPDGTNVMKKTNLNKVNLDIYEKANLNKTDSTDSNFYEVEKVKGKLPKKLDKQKIEEK